MSEVDWEQIFLEADFIPPEQRAGERHGVQIKVAWVHEGEQFKGVSADISLGGLFIASPHLLKRGLEFKLAFKLPTCEEPVRAVGRVAWIRPKPGESPWEPRGFGVEFVAISEQGMASVQKFLQLREVLLLGDTDL